MAVQAVYPAASKSQALATKPKAVAPPRHHKQPEGGPGGDYKISISTEAKANASALRKTAPVAAK